MQSPNAGYGASGTNVSITGSYLVTTICSELLMNTSLISIIGDLIEVLVRERHVRMLGKYRENRPGISYRNRSSAGRIMCTNGLLKFTDRVFAPYRCGVCAESTQSFSLRVIDLASRKVRSTGDLLVTQGCRQMPATLKPLSNGATGEIRTPDRSVRSWITELQLVV